MLAAVKNLLCRVTIAAAFMLCTSCCCFGLSDDVDDTDFNTVGPPHNEGVSGNL